jgi:hypothetical protein
MTVRPTGRSASPSSGMGHFAEGIEAIHQSAKQRAPVAVKAIGPKPRPSGEQEQEHPAHDKPETVHAQPPIRKRRFKVLPPLSAALSTIVGIVSAGCTYELPSARIVPGAVGVYVDKV